MVRFILALLLLASPAVARTMSEPLVIAHRGASGERPEHTRAAYELAIAQGADVIEPDLVMSKDGALIVRHENEISETTDVADHPAFADRRATRIIDGRAVTGWFTEDFTLAELKTLRARERLPQLRPGNTAFRDEVILTFDEVVAIARDAAEQTGRTIGVAPEIKHPAYFATLGLNIEDALVAALEQLGLTGADAPVLVQCFEVGPLERLSRRIDTPLVQLVMGWGGPADRPDLTYAAMLTPQGLAAIAAYADWLAPEATLILPRDADGRTTAASGLVGAAHAAGLKVVVWTLRAENLFLPLERRSGDDPAAHGDLEGYAAAMRVAGVDAVFSDFPGRVR